MDPDDTTEEAEDPFGRIEAMVVILRQEARIWGYDIGIERCGNCLRITWPADPKVVDHLIGKYNEIFGAGQFGTRGRFFTSTGIRRSYEADRGRSMG